VLDSMVSRIIGHDVKDGGGSRSEGNTEADEGLLARVGRV